MSEQGNARIKQAESYMDKFKKQVPGMKDGDGELCDDMVNGCKTFRGAFCWYPKILFK
ncbi:predicted protein [Sclerotinia sclerotiorum 1980 UF-70]|uniref:Uncharacterized protein n=1 Tax=Sclerotinia sclerotiorum (strain ATCC 18683 / 1980 / Ss-1) TaxID=665079 RepID=A7EK73_SCLS1|nr:predicted protein [Sclerotinia sclerotiorum 1980 UF-70]EDO03239.1 predicted protein [Sclerotinia sclerotiorum 1980 UF-70]